jgi:renalase
MQHDAYNDMPHSRTPRVAIIGAGMAGISCAHALQQRNHLVTLFEKSRGIGGRLATRRTDAGYLFDHGAQYITTRSSAFGGFMDTLAQQGAAAPWQPHLGDDAPDHHAWFVGTPGMSALLKPVAQSLDVHLNTAIGALERSEQGWQLRTVDGALVGDYDVVISTAPPVQTRALFAADQAMQKPLDAVAMAPCWTLMMVFAAAPEVDFDARRYDAGAIAWMARQASRPGHAEHPQAWVVHASAEWSAAHLELTSEQAASLIQHELSCAMGHALPEVVFAQAHRWRYAMTTQALGQPFLANHDRSLLAGGDWCLGARVECAYESGTAIAEAVADKLEHP